MDDLADNQAKQIVTPFGDAPWVQSGIQIKGPRSLKAMMAKLADSSTLDLNPELCVGLKKRMTYGSR